MKLAIICILLLALFGCSASQTQVMTDQIITWDEQNVAQIVTVSNQIMKHWAGNSIYWKIQIGTKLYDDEHFKLRQAWEALDKIGQDYAAAGNKLTEEQSFAVIAWWGKWAATGGKELALNIITQISALAAKAGIKM